MSDAQSLEELAWIARSNLDPSQCEKYEVRIECQIETEDREKGRRPAVADTSCTISDAQWFDVVIQEVDRDDYEYVAGFATLAEAERKAIEESKRLRCRWWHWVA